MLWPRAHAIPRVNKVKNWASWCINNLNYNKVVGQSAYHLPMILPFLAQRLFLIQISWNSKSVLSLGSYTCKNGQIRSAGRTVRQNRQFSGDRFFHVLDHLESIWKKKFSINFCPKKNFEIYRDDMIVSFLPGRGLKCSCNKSQILEIQLDMLKCDIEKNLLQFYQYKLFSNSD